MFSRSITANKNTPAGLLGTAAAEERAASPKASLKPEYQELKFTLHRKLVDKINLEALATIDNQRVRSRSAPGGDLADRRRADAAQLARKAADQRRSAGRSIRPGAARAAAAGSRPSPTSWSTPTSRSTSSGAGLLELTNVTFRDDQHLLRIIDKIVSQVGRRIDESTPMVDARLSDGSRVNAIIPPLAVDGPLLSIRRFSHGQADAAPIWWNARPDAGHDGAARSRGQGQDEHHHRGRNRRRKNHAAERALGVHQRQGTHRHHRRRGRIAVEAAARGAPRNPPAEHRRQRRGAPARIAGQQLAYASRPHRGRRSPRRGSAGHVAGHEHRSRRIADHGPRQHARATPFRAWK